MECGFKTLQNIRKLYKIQTQLRKISGFVLRFKEASGDVVITMDADLQDSPEEIPGLYNMIKKEGYDLVSGWKKKDMIQS